MRKPGKDSGPKRIGSVNSVKNKSEKKVEKSQKYVTDL